MKKKIAIVTMSLAFCFGSAASAASTLENNELTNSPLSVSENNNVQVGSKTEANQDSFDKDSLNPEALKAVNEYFNNFKKPQINSLGVNESLVDYKIVSADKSDPDNINVSVKLTYGDIGELPAAPYNLVKEEGNYIVKQPKGLVYDIAPTSSTYGKVETGVFVEPSKASQGNVQLAVRNLTYYSENHGMNLSQIGNFFGNYKNQVTFSGSQSIVDSDVQAIRVIYGVGTYKDGALVKLGVSSSVNGEGAYNKYVQVPSGSGRLAFADTRESSGNGLIHLEGNVLENE
ncbi:hypothetical protein [Paenibacillus polymyxa]|uniref:hypothetical protein n=1 Tax=Paenibacillus polymyxa TaxID=1406 RepID=UPI00287F82DE|nr:hypothetical protein [Paenibacillus polymyxa]